MFWNIFKREPKPFADGFLPVENGHSVYYLQYGNPNGIPVLSFHGGPGGSSRPKYASLFDLKKYRFIQFDQRGCGKSTYDALTEHNTTADLLNDGKRLLDFLHISDKIIVHGVSWGATLALLFAEKYPQLVNRIIVSSVFLARLQDVAWVNQDSYRFYPDLWEQMRQQVQTDDIFSAYYALLFSTEPKDNLKALSYLGSYEHMLGQLNPRFSEQTELDEGQLQSARVYFLYEKNNFFIENNQIIANAGKIKDIPTLIAHNRMDFCCPVNQAWDLHKALPHSKLIIEAGRGHASAPLLKRIKKELKSFPVA